MAKAIPAARVLAHLPLVRRIALRMLKHMPSNVLLDDLIQSGTLGLLDALRKYDTQQDTPLEHYASIRIQGAILDSLRSSDHLPRRWRQAQRQLAATVAREEQRLGRPPSASEMAEALAISLADFHALVLDDNTGRPVSLEDGQAEDYVQAGLCDASADPAHLYAQADFRRELLAAMGILPPRERKTLELYYDKELTLKECGAKLGVTESMACLLHRKALVRIRETLAVPAPVKSGR